MPPKTNLPERSLKILYNSGDNEVIEREYDEDDYRYPSRISKELRRNRKFKELFNIALDDFDDWHYQQCRFSNVLELLTNKNKVSLKQAIDKNKWKNYFLQFSAMLIRKLLIGGSCPLPNDCW